MGRRSFLHRFSFGGRLPGGVGLIIALTVLATLFVAFGSRRWFPLFEYTMLIPNQVLHGQVWRLLSWGFVQYSPWGLAFSCLILYWFGGDLARTWGSETFAKLYLGLVVLPAVGTCLLSFTDASIGPMPYSGFWALDAALNVAWGLTFPDRQIRIYFVIPISGRLLAWGTIAVTVATSIFYGWETVLPVLLAEALMLAWLYRVRLRRRWLEWKRDRLRAEQQRERDKRRARNPNLSLVPDNFEDNVEDNVGDELGDDDGDKPLSPEDEAKLRDALGNRPKGPRLVN